MTASQVTVETPGTTLTIAGYRVGRKLGTDELGDAYLAERTNPVQMVALRVLRPELSADEEVAREVRRRAELLAKVVKDHPNLVAVYQCGATDDGRLFVATEHVEGETLAEIIRSSGPLDLRRCLRLAVQIAQGLEFLHNSAGAVHGDLRPENVVVGGDGNTVKVRGFELAGARRTRPGDSSCPAVATSPEYLAPEQIRADAVAEPTDIYAFGLVVYEMLDGTPPFTASTPDAVTARQLEEAPLSLRRRHRGIPDSIDRLVLQTLEKAPERRPPNMTELANGLWTELSRLEEGIAKIKRRRPTWKAAGAASLSLLVTAALVWTIIWQKERVTATVTSLPVTVLPAPPVDTPTDRDRSEPDPVDDAATAAATPPLGSPSAAPVEPSVPPAAERVPVRPVAPTADAGSARRPPPGPSPSSDQIRREGGTLADQNVRPRDTAGSPAVPAPAMSPRRDGSGDPDAKAAAASSDRTARPLPPAPAAPDPSEIIDWLLRESSTAR